MVVFMTRSEAFLEIIFGLMTNNDPLTLESNISYLLIMSARQQIAAAKSGNSNSYSVIDRPMTRQLARQLSDSGRQHILSIELTIS